MNAMATPQPLCIAFSSFTPLIATERKCSKTVLAKCLRRRRLTSGVQTRYHSALPPQMSYSSSSSSSSSAASIEENTVFSEGAVTIVLSLKLKTHVSKFDARALLSEYARFTLREPDVLRCDVLFEVNKKGIATGPLYQIWTTFANAQAYLQHERTSHAAKFRIYVDSSKNLDTASLLTKLAQDAILLRPLYPNISKWKSSLQHEDMKDEHERRKRVNGKRDMQSPNLGDALEKTFQGKQEQHQKDLQREILDSLISNVGLEDVKIQISKATALSSDTMRKLRVECEEFLKDLERSPGLVRTGLLIDRSNPLCIILISVHDAEDTDGVFFDMELGSSLINDMGWIVKRFKSIFPDKIGWEKFIDEEEAIKLGFTESSKYSSLSSSSPTIEKFSSSLVPKSQTSESLANSNANTPSYRLLYGTSTFNNLKQYVRDSLGKPVNQDLRLMFLSGWNCSRLHPLLNQLEYRHQIDPARIIYEFSTGISNGETTIANIRRSIREIKNFKADGILGYGGGSVMDMGKIIARLVNCTSKQLDNILDQIQDGIDNDVGCLKLNIEDVKPMPLLLLPSALAAGVEMTDLIVIRGKVKNRNVSNSDVNAEESLLEEYKYGIDEWRHVFVTFQEEDDDQISQQCQKTILIDSRLPAPRRLPPACAAQAAICNTCVSIDAFLSSQPGARETIENESERFDYEIEKNTEGERFSLQAAGLNFRNVRYARREPHQSSGESRDALTKACMSLGISLDAVGRPGIAVRLSLAVVDSIFVERAEYSFRHVMIRVTIGLVNVLNSSGNEDDKKLLSEISRVMDVNGVDDIERMLLGRADECDVPLLPMAGFPRRKISYVCRRIASQLKNSVCNDLEKRFREPELLERILSHACSQKYQF